MLACSSLSASAQNVSPLATNLDPLFQPLLSQPADLANTLQYAQSAPPSGDIESAISTFEQLLFYNPKLANTRFQLGLLYYRLGSLDMARGYFETALQMPDITPDMRAKAEEFIAVIDKRLLPDQFSGFVQAGVRYQTNAALGPAPQATVAASGGFANRFAAQSDWNGFGAFGLNYVHDFQTQDNARFEAQVIGYDAQQFRLHQFDLGLFELRAGPRVGGDPSAPGDVSLKPYVVLTGTLLADAPYYGGTGGGLTVHANIAGISLDPFIEDVQQTYHNSTFYPFAAGLTGQVVTAGLQASGAVTAGANWQARIAYAHAQTDFQPFSYDSVIGDVYLPWSFTVPGSSGPWVVTPQAGFTTWKYAAAQPIDPTQTPHMLEWRVGLGLEVPIWKAVTLGMLVQYRQDLSNVAAFEMHDLAVSAGPTFRF